MENNPKYPMQYNSDNLVIMANKIIKGKQEMTLQEARLLRLLIMQIAKEDKDLKTYTTTVQDLAKFLDIPVNNMYRDIKKICDSIVGKKVKISTDNPKNLWESFVWIQYAGYDGKGNITLMLSDKIKPYVLELNAWFTKYKFKNILNINSFYALRFYELLVSEINISKKHSTKNFYKINFTINYLREFFSCENKLKQIGQFKEKLINIAIKELNDKTNLVITAEYTKTGRIITSVDFFIQEKQPLSLKKQKVSLDIQPQNHSDSSQKIADTQSKLDDSFSHVNDIISTIKQTFSESKISHDNPKNDSTSTDQQYPDEHIPLSEKYAFLFNSKPILDNDSNSSQQDINSQYLQEDLPNAYNEELSNSSGSTHDLDDLCDSLRDIFSEKLNTRDLKAILLAANYDISLIKSKYLIATSQGGINNLTAFLISAIKQNYSSPVDIKPHSLSKNRFLNFESRDWDCAELEKLDDEYLTKHLAQHRD